ncbi:MAG: protein kinase [Phycisphaerales bacterium]
MSDTRPSRIEEIFLLAVDLAPGQKTQFLNQACGTDGELRREVESLLGYHQDVGAPGGSTFLDSKASPGRGLLTQIGATAIKGDEPLLPPDRKLGQYTIRGVLGQGGMGVVYLAEQERPKRTVALKVMRQGIGSEKLVRRFEFEAELLGRLQHPGIAQIYEAGTFREDAPAGKGAGGANGGPFVPTAHPFIAMELVRGRPIIQHAVEERLPARQRLEILAKVCDAVQHAHLSGVIHRDLKPANILMGENGQPKILDFGVARLADRDIAVTTMQTSVGQIIGTLPYMSPEQVQGDPGDVDTRSDVYALGVVMYELLTERLPYRFKSHSLPEAARLIREEPPIRMSTVNRSLRGDVETIVAKALAKEKSRRYQSAADLAEDIRAYLDGRAIAARQDSALYVLRKQLKRYKEVAAATIVIVLGVLGFAIYANVQAARNAELARSETREKRRAEAALAEATHQRARADETAERLKQELTYVNIERGRLLGLSGNMSAAEELLWPEHLKNINSHQTFYALWELYANTRCEATLAAHRNGRVWRLRASPDFSILATTGLDPGVQFRDLQTYETISEFPGEGVPIQGLAFSPDGRVAIGTDRGRVALVDPRTGREIVELLGAGPMVIELVFDGTGERLIASHVDGSLTLLDARREHPEATEVGPPNRVLGTRRLAELGSRVPAARCHTLALRPGRNEIAAGCTDATIRLLSTEDLSLTHAIDDPENQILRVAFSPDGGRIASTGAIRLTRVYDVDSGRLLQTLNSPNGSMAGVCFMPDGERLVTSGWWYVQVWDLKSERVIDSFSVRAGASDVTVSPDGRHAWANLAGSIRAWELDPNGGRTRIEVPPLSRTLAVFGPPGELIAGGWDGSVSLIDENTGELRTVLSTGTRRIRSITVSPDRRRAAAVGVDNILFLYDLERREKIGQFPGYKMITNDGMRFDSTGSRLVLSGADDTFRVVEVPSGKVLVTIPRDGWEALGAAFSPDDKIIATTTRRVAMCLYDAQTGEKIRECDRPAGCPWTIVFTEDGQRVLSGNWDRTIDVWNVETGKLERRLEGHRGLVSDLQFRPREPNILASSGTDGRILLWDLNLPQNTPVLTLGGFEGWEVWSMDMHDKRALGTNTQGLTVIWNLRYFNRHIGGNMGVQIDAREAELGSSFDAAAARRQNVLLLNRGERPHESAPPAASPTQEPNRPAGVAPTG